MHIRVMIAEDQRLLLESFRDVLNTDEEIEVVATASDGKEAVALAERYEPDVVLMDVSMPHLDGLSATRIIHERVPTAKVLILSLYDTPAQVDKAMRAGIAGYVSKDVDLDELVRIIKSVYKGETVRSPFLADQQSGQAGEVRSYGLTPRELQVLKLLVAGENNIEIAERLCVSEQTIKKDLSDLFAKLKVKNRTQAAVKGFKLGLLDADTTE